MTKIDRLLSIASEPLAREPASTSELLSAYPHGAALLRMLQRKNGFYAYESALHVFPLTGDPGTGLEAWNAVPLWRDAYEDLGRDLLFFAEDALQDQFCLSLK